MRRDYGSFNDFRYGLALVVFIASKGQPVLEGISLGLFLGFAVVIAYPAAAARSISLARLGVVIVPVVCPYFVFLRYLPERFLPVVEGLSWSMIAYIQVILLVGIFSDVDKLLFAVVAVAVYLLTLLQMAISYAISWLAERLKAALWRAASEEVIQGIAGTEGYHQS